MVARAFIVALICLVWIAPTGIAERMDQRIIAYPEIVGPVDWARAEESARLATANPATSCEDRYIAAATLMRVGHYDKAAAAADRLSECIETIAIKASILESFARLYLAESIEARDSIAEDIQAGVSIALARKIKTDWTIGRSIDVIAAEAMNSFDYESAEHRLGLFSTYSQPENGNADHARLAIAFARFAEMQITDPARADYDLARKSLKNAFGVLRRLGSACDASAPACETGKIALRYTLAVARRFDSISLTLNKVEEIDLEDLKLHKALYGDMIEMCPGKIRGKNKLNFTTSSEVRRFGSGGVILDLSITSDGKMQLNEIYSSPAKLGPIARPVIEKAVRKWRYQFETDLPAGCQKNADSYLMPYAFYYR